MRHLLPLFLLAGCPTPDAVHCEDELLHHDWAPMGPAAWDPIRASIETCTRCELSEDTGDVDLSCEDVDPVFEDAQGQVIEARRDERLFMGARSWVPEEGWPVGTLSEATNDEWTHEVGPYGRDPDFDPYALSGTTWKLDPYSFHVVGGTFLSDTLESEGDYLVQILDAQPGHADFRVVWQRDSGACALLTDTASLTPEGELSWKRAEHLVPSEPAFQAWNLSLHLGFDSELQQAAGLEAGLLLDTSELSQHVCEGGDPYCICDLYQVFGEDCQACPDSDQLTCAPMWGYGGRLSQVTPVWGPDLDACDAQVGEDIVPSCEVGCDSTGGRTALPALLALLGLVGWRRRRR